MIGVLSNLHWLCWAGIVLVYIILGSCLVNYLDGEDRLPPVQLILGILGWPVYAILIGIVIIHYWLKETFWE